MQKRRVRTLSAWVQTKSKKPMKAPTVALTTKTSTVRFRAWSRVGQVTFFSSDQRLLDEAPDALQHGWFCRSSVGGGVAGAAGLEPTTTGFGDQSSTN